MKITKRTFLKASGTAAVCTCLGGSFCSVSAAMRLVSDTPVVPEGSFRVEPGGVFLDLAKIEPLAKTGGAVKLAVTDAARPDKKVKIIVIRTAETTYRAFPDVCTHGGMELEYVPADKKLRCISFGKSEFDVSGKVLGGLAKRPLIAYPVSLKGQELVVHLADAVSGKK